jgi:beta-glucosidase
VVTVANPHRTVDIARLAAVGGNVYSFTLFWTRIYPWALANTPLNQAGVDHYRDVIDYAWSQGVEPVVTLFHWDTPLAAQLAYGGFASERIVDDFVNYAVSRRDGTARSRLGVGGNRERGE